MDSELLEKHKRRQAEINAGLDKLFGQHEVTNEEINAFARTGYGLLDPNEVSGVSVLKNMLKAIPATGWFAELPRKRHPPEGSHFNTKPDERVILDLIGDDDSGSTSEDLNDSEGDKEASRKTRDLKQKKREERPDYSVPSSEDMLRDNAKDAFKLHLAGLREMRYPFDQRSKHNTKAIHPERIRKAAEAFSNDWQGLKPYQEDAVAMMLAAEMGVRGTSKGTMLLDEMGLGKTLEVIALMEENPVKPVLIVAPASALANWAEEFKKWLSPAPNVLMLSTESDIKDAIHKSAEEMRGYDIVLASYTRVRTEYNHLRNWIDDMEYRRANPYPAHCRRLIKVNKNTGENYYKVLDFQRPDCPLFSVVWGRVILDEAQNMKNVRGDTHKGCCALIAQLRVLMTGTPLVNDYLDFHAYFKFLKIYPLNDSAWFREHFINRASHEVVPDDEINLLTHVGRGGKLMRRSRPNEVMQLEVGRAALLTNFVRSHSIRRTRTMHFMGHPLVEDLPPIKRTEVWLDLEQKPLGFEREVYSRSRATSGGQRGSPLDTVLVQDFFRWAALENEGKLDQQKAESAAAVTKWSKDLPKFVPQDEAQMQYASRLQWCELLRSRTLDFMKKLPVAEDGKNVMTLMNQGRVAAVLPAAVDAKYGDEGKTGRNRKDFMAWLKENKRWSSTKVNWLLDHIGGKLKESNKNKAIIACHSLASLDVVAVALKANGITFLRIDGSIVGKNRSNVRHQFQDQNSSYRVLLLTTKAGGVALNLTAANFIYMISPDWSAAAEAQLEFRIYRLGQRQETEVIRIYANNSADLRCKSLQELKKKKEWGILDVMDHDVSGLEIGDETRLLVENTREKLEEMKFWDRKRFDAELRGVYREDRRGGLGLGIGQNSGSGSEEDDNSDEGPKWNEAGDDEDECDHSIKEEDYESDQVKNEDKGKVPRSYYCDSDDDEMDGEIKIEYGDDEMEW